MYLVIKKEKVSPRSKSSIQNTLFFTEFSSLEAYVLREGVENLKIFEGKELTFSLNLEEKKDVEE